MKTKKLIDYIYVLLIILFFVLSHFFVPTSDDLIFRYDESFQFNNIREFFNIVFYYGNGRYLGNTFLLVFSRIPEIFYAFETVLIVLFSLLFEKLTELKYSKNIVLLAFIFIPLGMFKGTIALMNSFINYFIPIFLLLVAFVILKYKCECECKKIGIWYVLLLILGFCEQLFIEHNTIINILLAIFAVIYAIKFGKNRTASILFLASNIIGAGVMFLHKYFIDYEKSYIYNNASGYRETVLSQNSIKDMILYCTKNVPFFLYLITTSIVLYFLAVTAMSYICKKKKKNTTPAIVLSCFYFPLFIMQNVYQIYSDDMGRKVKLTLLIMIAVCTIMSAIGFISLFYNSILKSKDSQLKFRILFFIAFSIISFAPFLLVSSCGYRSLMLSYVFMLTAVVYIFKYAYYEYKFSYDKIVLFIEMLAVILIAFYTTVYVREKQIYNYKIEYYKTSYYLPKQNDDFVLNAASIFEDEKHEYIPLDEWKKTVKID